MNPFFPVASAQTGAYSNLTSIQYLPAGGPIIRIIRDTTDDRVFIKFGGNELVSALSNADMMELTSGVMEELENPDPSRYDRFYLLSDGLPDEAVGVQISCSPTYKVTL